MSVLVVIVNYQTPDLTIDCLASLEGEVNSLSDCRVVVTDNASGDDSITKIDNAIQEYGWRNWVTLVPLPKNGGFSYGNNGAIRPALESPDPPDFVLMLNADTRVHPGAIQTLVARANSDQNIGIVGSRLEFADGRPQWSAFRFHTLASEFDSGLRLGIVSRLLANKVALQEIPEQAERRDWCAGASMLVRREVFEDIGLMDEGYFLYYEEMDFCLRAARAGWKTWYEPKSRVIHLVGHSTNMTRHDRAPQRRATYWFDSRRRFFVKNHGRLYAMAVDAAYSISYASWLARAKVQRKPAIDPPCFFRDFLRNSVYLRGFS